MHFDCEALLNAAYGVLCFVLGYRTAQAVERKRWHWRGRG